MSEISLTIARMVDTLPESEQLIALELTKRLMLAWDPDYTKFTAEEARHLAQAEKSGFIDDAEIDWDNLGKYTSP